MWATFRFSRDGPIYSVVNDVSRLLHQPAAEMVGTNADARWPSLQISSEGIDAIGLPDVAPEIGPLGTLSSVAMPCHGLRCGLRTFIGDPALGYDIFVRLGEHYGVRIWDQEAEAEDLEILRARNVTTNGVFTTKHIRFAIVDGTQILEVAKLPQYGQFTQSTGVGTISVAYVCDYDNAKMQLCGQWRGPVGVCGSATASLMATVDAERIGDGVATISVVRGLRMRLEGVALRSDPFYAQSEYVMERRSVRFGRDGTRLGSRYSRANQWPEPNASVFRIATEPNIAAYGQPDADLAWVPSSDGVRSNCGFSSAQNARMGKVSIDCEGLLLGRNLFPTFSIEDMPSNAYGNNTYYGKNESGFNTSITPSSGTWPIPPTPGESITSVKAFVTVRGSELAPIGAPVDDPELAYTIEATLFFWQDEILGTRTFTKALTEDEADDFFDGSPIEIAQPVAFSAGQKVTITPAG